MQDREFELKFEIAAGDVSRLLDHPILASSSRNSRTVRLSATYFDTPDGALRRLGVGLRLRGSPDGMVQTLKQVGRSQVDRHEWESAARGPRPDLAWLRTTPLAALFEDRKIVEALEPRFTVAVERTTFLVSWRGAVMECALDKGEIGAGPATEPVHEFEMELKRGAASTLLALARDLVKEVPLVLSLCSKAERGHRLLDGSAAHPNKPTVPGAVPRSNLDASFETAVQACLHDLTRNAALTSGAESVEAVHNTRIALRRLRGLLKLFKPALRRKALGRLEGDLKWLSRKLGDARDADVFQQDVFEPAASDPAVRDGAILAHVMQSERERVRRDLRNALASRRFRSLLLDVLDFASGGVRRKQRDVRARPFLRKRLERQRHALASKSQHLRRMPSDALHDVRKKAKTLRYNLDLMSKGKRPRLAKPAAHLQSDLQDLQEHLGALHDGEAMRAHLHRTVMARRHADCSKETIFAAGFIAGRPNGTAGALKKAIRAARRVSTSALK